MKELSLVNKRINTSLKSENKDGGLLENVNQIITSINFEDIQLDLPTIHIIEGETVEVKNEGNKLLMKTTIHFYGFDSDIDLFKGQIKVKDLSENVYKTILKNMNKKIDEKEPDRFFIKCKLNRLELMNEIKLTNIRPRISVSELILDFEYYIKLQKCYRMR